MWLLFNGLLNTIFFTHLVPTEYMTNSSQKDSEVFSVALAEYKILMIRKIYDLST